MLSIISLCGEQVKKNLPRRRTTHHAVSGTKSDRSALGRIENPPSNVGLETAEVMSRSRESPPDASGVADFGHSPAQMVP